MGNARLYCTGTWATAALERTKANRKGMAAFRMKQVVERGEVRKVKMGDFSEV